MGVEAAAIGFLVFGGFWFWALCVLLSIILLTCIENKGGIWATLALVVALISLQLWSDVKVFSWVINNPALALLSFVGYFGIGTLWSVGKWWFHVGNIRAKYDARREEFCEANGINPNEAIPANKQAKWQQAIAYLGPIPPSVRRHKTDIYLWIGYWPWSMFWTAFSDVIIAIVRRCYNCIAALLQKISIGRFSGTEGDFAHKPQVNE